MRKFIRGLASEENNRFSQPAFTCSKLILKTLDQGVKYKLTVKNDANAVVLVSLLLTLNIFHTLF